MSLLIFNGFDFLPTGSLFDNGPIEALAGSLGITNLGGNSAAMIQAPGRFGGKYMAGESFGHFYYNIPSNVGHGFLGFAAKMSEYLGNPQINFFDGNSNLCQFYLVFNLISANVGVFCYDVHNNASMVAISEPMVFNPGSWNYYEIEGLVAGSLGGYVQVRVNTVPVLTVPSITTRNPYTGGGFTSAASFSSIRFDNVWSLDDLYLCDDTGSAPLNTFLGDVRVQLLLPNGAGSHSDFACSNPSDANWQGASNTALNDTLYDYSSTVGASDSYTVTPLVNTPNVVAVQTRLCARQDDATARFLESVVISGGSEADGTSRPLSQTTYTFLSDIFVTDPATGSGWLYTAVNSAQIGMKVSG